MNLFEQLLQTILILLIVLLNLYLYLLPAPFCPCHRYPFYIYFPLTNRDLNGDILFHHLFYCFFLPWNILSLILLLCRSWSGSSFLLDDDWLLDGEIISPWWLWLRLCHSNLLVRASMMMLMSFRLRRTVEFTFDFE